MDRLLIKLTEMKKKSSSITFFLIIWHEKIRWCFNSEIREGDYQNNFEYGKIMFPPN